MHLGYANKESDILKHMSRYFTPAFSRFLFVFIAIIAVSVGLMVLVGQHIEENTTSVDNIAVPK